VLINNAGSRRSIRFWTSHLQNTEQNERAELKQIRGLAAANLSDALVEMQREAAVLPRLKNFMYHADFNPRPGEELTEAEWDLAFRIFEQRRGIPEGAPRIIYEHQKNGRLHRHGFWSRLDAEKMRAVRDDLDWKVAHQAARQIEWELGLQRTSGPLDRAPGTPRPKRAPKPWEMYRGMKTNIDPRQIEAEVTALRQQSQNGNAFQAALEAQGYRLVSGRRGLLILDSAGKEHSLARRCGMTMKQLLAFMHETDLKALPTLEQGQALHRQKESSAHDDPGGRFTEQREQRDDAPPAKDEEPPPPMQSELQEERPSETAWRDDQPAAAPTQERETGHEERPAEGQGTAVASEQSADEKARKPRLFPPGAIRALLREAMQALTGPKPTDRKRKQREEDATGLFRRAGSILWPRRHAGRLFKTARALASRAVSSIFDPRRFPWDGGGDAPETAGELYWGQHTQQTHPAHQPPSHDHGPSAGEGNNGQHLSLRL
jgi:hypothetical protein